MSFFRPVLYVISVFVIGLGLIMLIPMLTDLAYGHADWQVFAISSCLTLFLGGMGLIVNKDLKITISIRQAFILTTGTWLTLAAFAALPLYLSTLNLSPADAFFEAMSGITTTGSTVINGLDTAPPGILLWRSILQWIGGVGFIVMAVAILPMLQVGGMQLFKTESSDASEKILPRVGQIASGIAWTYFFLTFLCMACYWILGMPGFDAINHAMTTVSTAGFSTKDASMGYYGENAGILWTGSIFMLLGALPFLLYVRFLQGEPRPLFRDTQVRFFLILVVCACSLIILGRKTIAGEAFGETLHHSVFNIISIVTTTGFASEDYTLWGHFATIIFFICMFVGGCAGSTTGGMKSYRLQILFALARRQIMRLLRPHSIVIAYYNRRPVADTVAESVAGFFFFYILAMMGLAIVLSFYGLDFNTSLSGAVSAIANIGPGIGDVIGPAGNYASLPDGAKWWLSFGMLLGRLELFTVLVLIFPAFWRS